MAERTYFALRDNPYTLGIEYRSLGAALMAAAVMIERADESNKQRGTLIPLRVAVDLRHVDDGGSDRAVRQYTLEARDLS